MELRAYFFGNMYLSSIQQGIQAAHVVTEMFMKYPESRVDKMTTTDTYLWEWALDHKTMILLNGGYASEIRSLIQTFDDDQNTFPWANFHEGEDALDGALTSVGIILPEYIWVGAKQLREGWAENDEMAKWGYVSYDDWNDNMKPVKYNITKWEFELICQLNNYGLAK